MGRSRRSVTMLVGAAAALALVAAGCGGGGASGGLQGAQGQQVGKQDINARDVATLRDGGDLRMPEDQLPDNWNYNQADGPNVDAADVESALYPIIFRSGADGKPILDTDYVTSAEITGTNPQVITYKINPKANWDSGRPITWEDFAAQWKALDGKNPAFQAASTTGYEDIASVERGADDKEVRVTLATDFGEWKSLFSPLLPKELNADPNTFNTGWADKPGDTAGPFRIDSIDKTAKSITLVRNEKWWGDRPKLDRIVFRVYERAALADAAANNEIDFYEIGSSVDLYQRAKTTPGLVVRQAPTLQYNHITFNGAPGSILEDVNVRRAVAQGIDRHAIAQRLIGPIVPQIALMGSHIYPYNSADYEDHSGQIPYDPAAAAAALDKLGWVQQGDVRIKDGKQLNLRFVVPAANPISDQISRTVLDQLAKIGVKVTVEAVPTAGFFRDYTLRGNFDLTGFQWETTSTPLSSSKSLYAATTPGNLGQNIGSITTPQLQEQFKQAVAELDDTKRAQLGNQIDKEIWDLVHHLPLYPATGAVAVRDTLANFGAKGFGDWEWTKVGYIQL